MIDKEKLKEIVNRLKTEVADFEKAEDATDYAKIEFMKLGISEKKSKEYAHRLVLKCGKPTKKTKSVSSKVSSARRKELGKYWSVTTETGSEEFRKGLEALQEIRKGFYNDSEWEGMDLKKQYKFIDHIEEILKNPGKYRDNEDYETIKIALMTAPSTSAEPVDKIEEAALMALGVLKRRRGSEKQIARMSSGRQAQRRAARNVLTFWTPDGGPNPNPIPNPNPNPIPNPNPNPTGTPTGSPSPSPATTPKMIVVDSSPMREVHIEVRTKIKLRKGLTDEDLAKEFGVDKSNFTIIRTMKVAKLFSDVMTDPTKINPTIVASVMASAVAAGFIAASAVSPTGYITTGNRSAAVNWVDDQLAAEGLTRNRTILANYVVDAYYEEREDWYKLDELRSTALRNRDSVNFGLKRPPQYLAIKNQDNRETRRFAGAGGLLQGSIDLNLPNLVKDVVDRNTFTYFELVLAPGWYRFTAEPNARSGIHPGDESGGDAKASFERWEIKRFEHGRPGVNPDNAEIYDIRTTSGRNATDSRYVRSMQHGVVTHWDNVLEINITCPTKLVAYYHEDAKVAAGDREKKKRDEGINTYQRGGGGSPYTGPTSLNASRFFGRSGIRNRLSREVTQRQLKKDPFLLAASNKGKRMLNSYAKAEYSRIFNPITRDYNRRAVELRQLGARAAAARVQLRRIIRGQARRSAGLGMMQRSDQDMINAAETLAARDGLMAGNVALNDAHDLLQNYINSRDKFYDDYKRDSESAAAQLTAYLKNKAQTIAIRLARQYRMPTNSSDEDELKQDLDAYAGEIAENFVARGRSASHAFMRGLSITSRGLETASATGMNVFSNTVNFIFGPWTIMAVFALLEFFFVLTYVGYNLTYLWIFPLIGAAFTFILNFSNSFKPLDWVTHLSSGAVIGYSAMLLLIALGALNWSFMSTFWFWIIWAILGFLGIMQFYQNGGWKVVLQGAVIILIFAYAALGPYSAYYQQALDQVKTPVEIAWRAVSSAISDVWLLATNPTAWYARQQLVNVRPEHPIDFPKGIEVTMLEALPPSVPAGMEFGLTAVIKNEGSIKEPAKDIILSLGCNQWCDSNNAKPTATDTKRTISLGSGRNAYNITPDNGKMERGDAVSMNVRGFVSLGQSGREGETRLADILFNLSYRYSTSSSLFVEVMSSTEMNRRIQNNENIFKNVIAVTKSSPAQLSLNVGPQPLMANQRSLLLVSVSNTRDESKILLKRGTKIIITMPSSVGSDLRCGNSQLINNPAEGKEVVEYTVPEDVTVLPYEFRSIFAFLCDFTAADAVSVTTDLVTADIPDYTFVLTKKKQIPITPQIGILYNPYESQCNKCGTEDNIIADSAFLRCTDSDCYGKTNYDTNKGQTGACWFEYSGMIFRAAPLSYVGGSRCHACGPNTRCERFITPGDCNSESKKCGLSCEWDPAARRPSPIGDVNEALTGGSLDPNSGACKTKVVPGISLAGTSTTGTATAQCNAVPSNFKAAYETYKDKIATAIDTFGLGTKVGSRAEAAALVAGVISQESGWVMKTGDGGTSFGLMQIHLSVHPECSSLGDVKSDPEANIKCGVKILSDLAQQHFNDAPRNYPCTVIGMTGYAGTNAVLRYYNGWPNACNSGTVGCCDKGDSNYVENVRRGNGHLDDWLDCFNAVGTMPPNP